jgi:hypothetical protein
MSIVAKFKNNASDFLEQPLQSFGQLPNGKQTSPNFLALLENLPSPKEKTFKFHK